MTIDPQRLGPSKAVLAKRLRELRQQAGLTGDRLAHRCNISQSKISKIENGKIAPTVTDVARILAALDVPHDIAADVIDLARLANTEWDAIRASWRRGLVKRQTELAALEANARQLRYFLPAMITGLLATPEYVKASLEYTPGDPSPTIAGKLERQTVLYDRSKQFTFILTAQAATWPVVAPDAMAIQLDHLVSLSHLPSVRICVANHGGRQSRGPMNTFTIYDDRLVTVESFTGRLVFQDARDITEHLEVFALYEAHSLHNEDARTRIRQWANAFRK